MHLHCRISTCLLLRPCLLIDIVIIQPPSKDSYKEPPKKGLHVRCFYRFKNTYINKAPTSPRGLSSKSAWLHLLLSCWPDVNCKNKKIRSTYYTPPWTHVLDHSFLPSPQARKGLCRHTFVHWALDQASSNILMNWSNVPAAKKQDGNGACMLVLLKHLWTWAKGPWPGLRINALPMFFMLVYLGA